ncbi:hypothetical protein BCR42DRAFT_493515 [Absidia repens]|uniref:Zn(2)-C6 fungal-type domain-containing protein n=1 Tax=Absidia repens TaxID=90262 RepID=A0A1X2IAL6_9FUNG|nr:hypothetical protein BCR42DRAFT_493515 [Absidia repens]
MQYTPPYYYGAPNQQSPNIQQTQPQQHHQQQQQPQQPQLQMPDHQMYHHGIPTYPMSMPPHQPHPAMVHAGGDFNMLTKPKRKQVKNACVNCQKACKKCDDGRPCQRCIKYGLSETCTNSVRKERKKGVKRGPYKRRNQANEESSSPVNVSTYPNPNPGAVPTPYQTYANYDAYQSTNPNTAYTNPMQQYVMAMQQQQAMYQNLPYQQPMTSATTSSPALSHHAPIPPAAPHSAQPSPVTTNATPDIATKIESTGSSTANHTETDNTNVNKNNNDDEDGSKLNILSQLCSDVLDRSPKEEHATMTPPPNNGSSSTGVPDHPSPASTNATSTTSSYPHQQQQHTPIMSTPISSSPSSANSSPTLHKQDPQMVYPQQQQNQGQGENIWQGHW